MALAGALAAVGGIVFASRLVEVQERREELPRQLLVRGRGGQGGESRNRTSQLLLLGAGVSGATGVTVFLLNPGPPEARPAGSPLRLGRTLLTWARAPGGDVVAAWRPAAGCFPDPDKLRAVA